MLAACCVPGMGLGARDPATEAGAQLWNRIQDRSEREERRLQGLTWEVPLNLVMLGVVACPDISVGPSTCPVLPSLS